MPNVEQILELAKVGFSKDEILSFFKTSEKEGENTKTPESKPVEESLEKGMQKNNEKEPVEEGGENEYETRFSAIESAINNLTNVIQKNNILLATKDYEIKKVTPEEAADAAIKKFFGGK